MSSLNTNYINNTTRTTVGNSEKNLQLGSDGSVTSFEGLSISDAAASNGLNYYRTWLGTNFNETFSFDRTKYNTLRLKGWFDLSYEPSNALAIGLFIQPCIDGSAYTLSQVNGGNTGTFIQTTFDTSVSQYLTDQMLYNSVPTNTTFGYRWIINHEFILNSTTAWSTPNLVSFINLTTGNISGIIRQLTPSSWNTTNGNAVNGFRIITNSISNVSTISKGQLAISISRNSGYAP